MSKKQFKEFKYSQVKGFIKLWNSLDSVSKIIHETDFHNQVRRDILESNFFMQGCK